MRKAILIVFAVIAVIIFGGCFALFYLPELLIQRIIHVPPDTKLVYEATVRYGANAATRSLYYLSDKNINDLENWYKDYYSPFRSGDPLKRWLITALATDSKALNTRGITADTSSSLIHESLCSYQYSYDCLTVAMLDTSVEDLISLFIVSDDGFAPQPDTQLYTMLSTLPKTGTLIMYRYYVFDA